MLVLVIVFSLICYQWTQIIKFVSHLYEDFLVVVERYAWDSECQRHSHLQYAASLSPRIQHLVGEWKERKSTIAQEVFVNHGPYLEINCFNSIFINQNSITYPYLIPRQTEECL